MSLEKLDVLTRIVDSGLIAILRATEAAADPGRIADACIEGGAHVIEVTFTVPGAAQIIEQLSRRYKPGDLVVGAGTVLDPETARIAILAGAKFIVSPSLNPDTARLCNRYQIAHMPGAGTVREILACMEHGAEIVKIFPSDTAGPGFIRAVLSPLPHAALMPTGGISLQNAGDWIRAGAVAVGASGHLTAAALRGDFRAVTETAKRFLEEIRKAREQR